MGTITNRDLEENISTPVLLLGAHKGTVTDSVLCGGERFQSVLGSGPPQNPEGAEQAQRNTTAKELALSVCMEWKCLMIAASVKAILE